MKRKIFSFLLAVVMVLGMLPTVSLADTPTIGFKDTGVNNGTFFTYSGFHTSMDRPVTYSHSITFYYGTESSHSLLTGITNVSLADPSYGEVRVSDTAPTGEVVYYVEFYKIGSTAFVVTTSSGTYTLPITTTLPGFGPYTQPTVHEDYLINHDFCFSDTQRTFYLILDDAQLALDSVTAGNGQFNITLSADKSYATVEIVDDSNLDGCYFDFRARIIARDDGRNMGIWNCSVRFVDTQPAIGYVDAWINNGTFNSGNNFHKELNLSINGNAQFTFGYGTSANYTLLTDIVSVTCADPSIATVEPSATADTGESTWHLEPIRVGQTSLIVKTTSATYQMPLNVEMGPICTSSTPNYSAADAIPSFAVTETADTFYFVTPSGVTISAVAAEDNFKDAFQITVAADGRSAAVKVIAPEKLTAYRVRFDVTFNRGWGDTTWSIGFRMRNEKPGIGFKFAWWNNNQIEPWSDFFSSLSDGFGSSPTVIFYYGTPDAHTPLDVASVTSANPNLTTVEFCDTAADGSKAYNLEFIKPGTTELIVTAADGSEYRLPVTSNLYNLWVFSDAAFDPNLAIKSFSVTETEDTFYLVGKAGVTLKDVEIEADFAAAFTTTLSQDGSYIAVKVTNPTLLPPNSNYRIRFDVTLNDGRGEYINDVYFSVRNNVPGVGIQYAHRENDEIVVADWSRFSGSMTQSLSSSPAVLFYYGTADNYALLDVANVTPADPSMATVEFWGTTADGAKAYLMEFHKVGSTELIVTATDGTEYRLPLVIGLDGIWAFSAPTYDPNLALKSFAVTETEDTFYIVGKNGVSLKGVEIQAEFSNAFTTTVAQDGSYIAVKVTDPSPLPSYDIRFRVSYNNGYRDDDYSIWFRVRNEKPGIGFKRVGYNNGQIEPWSDFRSSLQDGFGSSPALTFYYGTAENHTALDVASVIPADPNLVTVEFWDTTTDGGKAYFVDFIRPGSTELIITTTDGTEYRLSVTSSLYDVWAFSDSDFDPNLAIKSFSVTETEDTFYLVGNTGITLQGVEVSPEYADAFDFTVAQDGSHIAVKVTDPALLPRHNIQFLVSCHDGNGNWKSNVWFTVLNEKPSIGICYQGHDGSYSSFQYSIEQTFGNDCVVSFCYGTQDNYTKLDVASVTAATPNLVEVRTAATDTYFLIFNMPCSTELIVTTTDGTEYRIPVNIDLSEVWFFSEDTNLPGYAIRTFEYSAAKDTFYVAGKSHCTIQRVEVAPEFAGAFTITPSRSGNSFAVQITDPYRLPQNPGHFIEFMVTYDDGYRTISRSAWINVRIEEPMLGVLPASCENDVWDLYGDYVHYVNLHIGTWFVVPCYGTYSQYAPIGDIVSAVAEDPALFSVAKIGPAVSGGTVYAIEVNNPYVSGTTNLVLTTADGTVYKMPVSVLPPMAGAYETATSTNAIYEFAFTDDKREVYIKATDSTKSILGIEVFSSFGNAFSVNLTPDGVAVIRLEDPSAFSSETLWMEVQLETEHGWTWYSFWVKLTNKVTPPQADNAVAVPVQYPTWTNEESGTVANLEEAEQITVTVPVENTGSETTTVQAMLAIYNEAGMLLDVRCATLTLSANGEDVLELNVDLTGLNNPHHAVLFLLDGQFRPISTVFEL